jgi:hypothetical protein
MIDLQKLVGGGPGSSATRTRRRLSTVRGREQRQPAAEEEVVYME